MFSLISFADFVVSLTVLLISFSPSNCFFRLLICSNGLITSIAFFKVPKFFINLLISLTAAILKSKTSFISSSSSVPIVLASVSIVSCNVDNLPLRVVDCFVAPPKNAPPSFVRFIRA